MDENPYQAPRVEDDLPRQRAPNRSRSISLAGLCVFFGLVWFIFVIAIVAHSVETVVGGKQVTLPTTGERVLWLLIGVIPGIWLFWMARRLVRR
jgi:hypothetical protein